MEKLPASNQGRRGEISSQYYRIRLHATYHEKKMICWERKEKEKDSSRSLGGERGEERKRLWNSWS